MNKKMPAILGIIIVIVLGIAVIGIIARRYDSVPDEDIEVAELAKDNWKTLEKIDAWGNSCSIKVPDNWQIPTASDIKAHPPERAATEKMYTYVTVDCISEEKAKKYGKKGEKLGLLSVCNKENFSVLWTDETSSSFIKEFCILKEDGSKVGIVRFETKYGYIWSDFERVFKPELDAVSQMLSTFEFIENRSPSAELCEYIISYKEDDRNKFSSRRESINKEMQKGGVGGLECPFEINDENYYIYFDKSKVVKILDENKKPLVGIESDDIDLWTFQEYGHSIFHLIDDINFDGYKDLRILTESGYMGSSLYYDFYIFDPMYKSFKKSISLSNYQIDYEKKEIRESQKIGPTYCGAVYQFDGKGYLLTSDSRYDYCGPLEEGMYIEIEKTYESSKWREFYSKYGDNFEKEGGMLEKISIDKDTILFSPNEKLVSFIVKGYEFSMPYIVDADSGVNVLEEHNIWFNNPQESLIWFSGEELFVVKSFLNEFDGRGKEAIFISKGEGYKLEEIYSLTNEEYLSGLHIDNIEFSDNKISFSVVKRIISEDYETRLEIQDNYLYDIKEQEMSVVF